MVPKSYDEVVHNYYKKPKGPQLGSKQNQMSEIDQFNMLPKSQDIEQKSTLNQNKLYLGIKNPKK